MIDRLFSAFRDIIEASPEEAIKDDDAIKLAAAALMFEVARSDEAQQQVELETIEQLLKQTLNVDQDRIHEMMVAASGNVEVAHDLYQFTQLINEAYTFDQKLQLILAMWLVAFADGRIAAIEDHIIRRVAGLIHVPHADFIRLKLQARDSS